MRLDEFYMISTRGHANRHENPTIKNERLFVLELVACFLVLPLTGISIVWDSILDRLAGIKVSYEGLLHRLVLLPIYYFVHFLAAAYAGMIMGSDSFLFSLLVGTAVLVLLVYTLGRFRKHTI